MRKTISPGIALFFFVINIAVTQTSNSVEIEIKTLLKTADNYNSEEKYSESLNVYETALELYNSRIGAEDSLLGVLFDKIGEVHIDLGEYSKAKKYFDEYLGLQRKISEPGSIEMGEAFFNLGLYYDYTNEFERALEFYSKAEKNFLKLLPKSQRNLSKTYFNEAICYALLEDYQKAIQLNKKTLEFDSEFFGKDHIEIAYDLNNLGILYYYIDDKEKALACYVECERILKKNGQGQNLEMARLSLNIGSLYNDLNEYENAIEYLSHSLNIYNKFLPKNDHRIIRNTWILASVYFNRKNNNRALHYLELAYNLSKQNENIQWKTYQVILSYFSQSYLALSNPKKAQTYLQKAINHTFPDTTLVATCTNAKKMDAWASLMVHRGDISMAFFEQTTEVGHLEAAQNDYGKALAIWQQQRESFYGDQSKKTWGAKRYAVFEKAIACQYALAEVTGELRHWHQAYDLAEQSRALLLLDALQESKAAQFAGIPNRLLEKEAALSEQIATLEEGIFAADQNDGLDSTTVTLNGQLFEVQQSHDSLIHFLEKEYPKYYQLKYDRETIGVLNLQRQALAEDEGVLQYFVGDSSLFVFLIGPKEFQVRQIPLDFPLEQWVADWRQAVADYGNGHRHEAAAENYLQRSRQLYDKLWHPLAEDLPTRLTIIADGALGYLPFEALLVSTPEDLGGYRNYDYLLHHHQISYAFSTTWWQAQKDKLHSSAKTSGLLAMAPEFAGRPLADAKRSEPLAALLHNQEEARSIAQLWGGKAYTGSEATEATFRELAAQYQILHLATHAKANDQSGDYSYLAFSEIPDSLDNETLYARELYELSLHADLVVLSACETGVGELQKGEGIISLARGFSYAGARSILTTLWQVSDDKAAQLMIRFYEKLRDQMPKDEALRESKMAYLATCRDREAHPFYWAAFVGLGNMDAVEVSEQWSWRWLGISFVIVVTLLLFKKKTTKI